MADVKAWEENWRHSAVISVLAAAVVLLAIMWRVCRPLGKSMYSSYSSKRGSSGRFFLSHVGMLLVGVILGVSIAAFNKVQSQSPPLQPPPTTVKDVNCEPKEDIYHRPKGTTSLPPKMIEEHADFYLRRLWGKPEEDLPSKPKYLLALMVGVANRDYADNIVEKFTNAWTIMMFHYDNKLEEWEDSPWTINAIHVAAKKQSKWWFAKRFLHPDVVAKYEYIFLWDESLDVTHFDGVKYIEVVKRLGYEISQPAFVGEGMTWQMTKRVENLEAHTRTDKENSKMCPKGPDLPPCAGFVEISAPVFTADAWRCVWHIIQDDLVHGWGLDFSLHHCTKRPAHEAIAVIDSQYVSHILGLPSVEERLEDDEETETPWESIDERAKYEWHLFKKRWEAAEEAIAEKKPEVEGKVVLV